jgi:hypothetical protein
MVVVPPCGAWHLHCSGVAPSVRNGAADVVSSLAERAGRTGQGGAGRTGNADDDDQGNVDDVGRW